jgi:hypothetical protein
MGKQYPVRLVGEQHYRDACGACKIGDTIFIFRETHNPHDKKAIVAKNEMGQTIGYVPRESFVQGVIHDQLQSVYAEITEKFMEHGQWQIELAVEVRAKPATVSRYKSTADERQQAKEKRERIAPARAVAVAAADRAEQTGLINEEITRPEPVRPVMSVIVAVAVGAAAIWLAVKWIG